MKRALVLLAILIAAVVYAQSPSMTVTVTLLPQVDVFQNASLTYTLTKAPAASAPVQVYVNGILMCGPCGNDYTLLGTGLTFTGQQTDQMASPVVQVSYWVVAGL
jgi:hypothetical protein